MLTPQGFEGFCAIKSQSPQTFIAGLRAQLTFIKKNNRRATPVKTILTKTA